jgi:hypothetical protein
MGEVDVVVDEFAGEARLGRGSGGAGREEGRG